MKKIYILLIAVLLNGYAKPTLVDQINYKLDEAEKIDKIRVDKKVYIKYDPFYGGKLYRPSFKETKQLIKKRNNNLTLSSIFDKKAFINSKWYKENDKIYDYTIIKINKDSVFLKNKNKVIVLRVLPSTQLLSVKETLK